MSVKWKKLTSCIAIPLAVGGLSALLTQGSMETFATLQKPPLSPPGWLFPVVWTVLYVMMGVASWLVLRSAQSAQERKQALTVYGMQLAVNFFWSILFFNLSLFLFALAWLALLWVLIVVTMVLFYPIDKRAGDLLLPYLLWVTFAGYLNWGVYMLN